MRNVPVLPARRDHTRRGWLRGAPPPWWVKILPVLLIAGVCVAALVSPSPLDIGFLLGAIPPLAVLSYSPWSTAILGGAVITVLMVPAFQLNRPGNTDLLTVVFVAVLSVFVSYVRSRRDAQLDLERTVAEAAQRAVLPPLPERVGAVRCAGLYRAAERGTLVGGDFFDVREGPYGVRAVLGDVQGHGLSAIATVASLLGAFREAVLDQPDLESVAARLDRRLVADSASSRYAELFATAVLLEFSRDARSVRLVSCGHPAPLLLRGRQATEIELTAWTPLGLGLPASGPPAALTLRLEPGHSLFLASDGVSEGRDAVGTFYPLTDRLAALADTDPAVLADRVWADLVRYCPAVVDDVTMLVLTPASPDAR
ncbi:serine/threonine-protein phosphatase [Streptomyces spinosirectus]|uniref:PP2C family protein-serine/threonine phosphatase n=1 Tax=Streptomyces TaxID=1883 RepID=UPI001C9DC0A7|nr:MULTISPECIES: PP2C family protein-serine/threonine phosphatase [Streptomyces]MBY8344489.1 serine/threonine-protein phosphatase [Streptomyces plumbidurans]UIR22190.1 serine/threonine-protein phosphatase [Streptomyces spinosirectus]